MVDPSAVRRFIRSAFGSVWSLELLLLLRQRPEHRWTRDELIQSLRASEEVLNRSTQDLLTAGLGSVDNDGQVSYAPASPELEETVAAVDALYSSRPTSVRRLIVGGGQDPVISFADAFRFRRDHGDE